MNLRERVHTFADALEAYVNKNNALLDANEEPTFFPDCFSDEYKKDHIIFIELFRREIILLRIEIVTFKNDETFLPRLFFIDEVINEFATRMYTRTKQHFGPRRYDVFCKDADLRLVADAVIADDRFVRRMRTRADFDNLFDAIVVPKYINPDLLALISRTDVEAPVSVEVVIDFTTGTCKWHKAFGTGDDLAEYPVFNVSEIPDINARVWINFFARGSKHHELYTQRIPRALHQVWTNPVNNKRWTFLTIAPAPAPVSSVPAPESTTPSRAREDDDEEGAPPKKR
jgi:hypothetical protein